MQKWFEKLDTSQDGSINKYEMIAALQLMGVDLRGDVVDRVMQTIDEDNSGEVGFEEFCTLLHAVQSDHAREVFERERDDVTRRMSSFIVVEDADGNRV